MGLLLLFGGMGAVEAYPHYLLNPEGCKTKKLEVRFFVWVFGSVGVWVGGTDSQSEAYVCMYVCM